MKRVLLVLTVLLAIPLALGVPQPPHEFYGVISDDSGDAAEDIAVEARISGSTISSDSTDANGEYTVQVSSDRSGETVDIYVDGSQEESYTVQVGATTSLDVEGAFIEDDDSGGGDDDDADDDSGGGGSFSGSSSGEDDAPEPVQQSLQTTSDGKQSTTIDNVQANQQVTVTSDDEDSTVESVSFTSSSDADSATVTVDDLGSQEPRNVERPSRDVYGYQNISVSGVEEEDITESNITFTVNRSYLDQRNRTTDDVVLQRYVDGSWQELETRFLEQVGNRYRFQARTTGYSIYAITLRDQENETQEVQPEPRFTVSSLTVDPQEGPRPLDVTVNTTVRNDGSAEGTYAINVQVDGETEKSETVTLAQDTSTTRSYQVRFNQTGTYTVQVSDKARAVTVNPAPDENTTLLFAIALIVALGLVYVYVRDQYPKLP